MEFSPSSEASKWLHAIFFFLAVLLAIVFIEAGLKRASRNTLWLDEAHALEQSRREDSYGRLLLHGPARQMSPAPLGYVFEKGLDDIREATRYFGLTPFAYYRLASIGATASLGLLACFVIWTRIRKNEPGICFLQALLTLGSLGAFYFQHDVFHYAAEMRPYALWNSLWFLALVVSTCRCAWPMQAMVLTLTALSATAAVLQIFALGLASALVIMGAGAGWKKSTREILQIFAVPSIVALYFSLRTSHWAFETYGSWPGFLKFWLRSSFGLWLVTGMAAALAWFKRPLWHYATGPTAMVALLLLGPVAFFAASQKGMVYSPRHYMYWGMAWPVALMVLALAAPSLVAGRRRHLKIAACVLVMAVAVLNTASTLQRRVKEHPPGRFRPAFLETGSAIAGFLKEERPAFIRHDPAMDPVLAFNLQLLAEWIPVSFPHAKPSSRQLLMRESGPELVGSIVESASDDLAKIRVSP
jgi:hypothetical protein